MEVLSVKCLWVLVSPDVLDLSWGRSGGGKWGFLLGWVCFALD